MTFGAEPGTIEKAQCLLSPTHEQRAIKPKKKKKKPFILICGMVVSVGQVEEPPRSPPCSALVPATIINPSRPAAVPALFLLPLVRRSCFCCPAMAALVEDTMRLEVLDRQPDASSASSSNPDARQHSPPQSESDFRCGICKKSYSRRTRRRMWMWPDEPKR